MTAAMDGLSPLWNDDAQVVELHAEKRYAVDSAPRWEIAIEALTTSAVSGVRTRIPPQHSSRPSVTHTARPWGIAGAHFPPASPASPNAHGDSNGPFP